MSISDIYSKRNFDDNWILKFIGRIQRDPNKIDKIRREGSLPLIKSGFSIYESEWISGAVRYGRTKEEFDKMLRE